MITPEQDALYKQMVQAGTMTHERYEQLKELNSQPAEPATDGSIDIAEDNSGIANTGDNNTITYNFFARDDEHVASQMKNWTLPKVADDLHELLIKEELELDTYLLLCDKCLSDYSTLEVQTRRIKSLDQVLTALIVDREHGNKGTPFLRFLHLLTKLEQISGELKKAITQRLIDAPKIDAFNVHSADVSKIQSTVFLPDEKYNKWSILKVKVDFATGEKNLDHLSVVIYWYSPSRGFQRLLKEPLISWKTLLEKIDNAVENHKPERIELFLPSLLMSQDIEFVEMDSEYFGRCLADNIFVVRRLAERQAISSRGPKGRMLKLAHDKWLERWRTFKNDDNPDMGHHHKWIDSSELHSNFEKIMKKTRSEGSIQSISVHSSENITKISELGLLAGIPIILLPQYAPMVFKDGVKNCPQNVFEELLAKYQQEGAGQLTSNSAECWSKFFVVLDDPTRPFPNQSNLTVSEGE